MVIKSPYPDIEIPEINILTYLYGNGDDAADTPLWIDSADDTKSLSAREGLQWIKRLAQGLERAGIKEGEVVMVVSPNHIFVPIAYLGTVAGGRIFSGANPAYNADELSYQMKDAGTRTILVHPSLLSTAKKAATRANLPHTSLYLFSDIPKAPIEGIQDWRSLLAPSQEASSYQWPSLTGSESKTTIATINYSSGTTGLPKGVMISHYNLVANVEQSRNVKHVTQTDDDPSRERWVGFLPLYHAYGQMFSVMLSLKLGIRIYIMQAFEFERFLQVVQDKKITSLQLAPPIAVLLDKHPSVGKYDLSSVETLSCGAAPLASSLQNAISTRFKAPIGQGWGMTEVTCAGLGVPAGVYDDTGSVGQLLPNCEIKLMNEEGGEVKLGERGEIYFRGPNVSPGYWKNEQATRETMLADGWLRTGDVGVANEEGWVWIVDRLKELIKVSSFQVAPAELEAVLLTHDAIADAAVVGVSSSFSGKELVRAYIVVKPEAQGRVTEQDVVRFMEGKVARYKRLTGGAKFVDQIPKSPAGKILRKVLKEWAKKDGMVRAKL